MSAEGHVSDRRGFLGQLAAAGAAVGLSSTIAGQLAAERPGSFGAESDASLAAWFGRMRGNHRIVFDAPAANSGFPAIWPRIYLMTMGATYRGESGTAVLVARHEGLALALDDRIWAKYPIAEMFRLTGEGGKKPAANPFKSITGLPLPGIGVAELLKSDNILVGACGMAIKVYGAAAAKQMNLDPAAVEKEWTEGLIPGVQLLPSGVMAVGRAQELGCQYCFAG